MGRSVRYISVKNDIKKMMKNIEEQALEMGMAAIEKNVRGIASSIVDPETGKVPVVRVRRKGNSRAEVLTSGSEAYKAILNKELGGVDISGVEVCSIQPLVYLAHASEDKGVARPLAEALMACGINVWFDQWEITGGDSLRRKMEQGLGDCTHFVALLSEKSINKPWVQEEIDAGFVLKVNNSCKFMGLRLGLEVSTLSPFLQAQLVRAYAPDNQVLFDELKDDILGVGRKPVLGALPSYVNSTPEGLVGWSDAAIAVAKEFVVSSPDGMSMSPMYGLAEVMTNAGLSEDVALDGLMDLEARGLLHVSRTMSSCTWWPEPALFVEFDEHFMGWLPSDDAISCQ